MTRPRAYEHDTYPWNFRRLPAADPAKKYGVFVVHGIGVQDWTETAANLRSGFEDALVRISKWQADEKNVPVNPDSFHRFPPPFVFDGHWSNYADLEKTFPEDWKHFNNREQDFFTKVWAKRTISTARTILWFGYQQLRLLWPGVLRKGGVTIWSYVLYWMMAIPALIFLVFVGLRHPLIVTGFLRDVRLYAAPDGIVERAIVQRIDYRVGRAFLSMIGLDWDFRPLSLSEDLDILGERADFQRIVWVSHSLGSVISYNVISDLCHRAIDLKETGDMDQKNGANKFLDRLYRFVTLGSPLDKFAFLFPETLRQWPKDLAEHLRLPIPKGKKKGQPSGFWVNFYSAFDPVSGALDNPVYRDFTPRNFHIRNMLGWIPAISHTAYWKDIFTLSYILSRTAGKEVLPYRRFEALTALNRRIRVFLAYLAWFGVFGGGLAALYIYRWELFEIVKNWVLNFFT